MKDLKREDMNLFLGGRYNRKYMENGEIRTRLVLPDGTRMSHTEMGTYDMYAGNLPWQEAHFHRGLIESYTLVTGWAHFIYGQPPLSTCHLIEPGQTIKFLPGVPHVVLLGPGAKIITNLFGAPVENSERNNEDWWPADNTFATPALLEQVRVEEDFVHC